MVRLAQHLYERANDDVKIGVYMDERECMLSRCCTSYTPIFQSACTYTVVTTNKHAYYIEIEDQVIYLHYCNHKMLAEEHVSAGLAEP
jgi:hypothetical protein